MKDGDIRIRTYHEKSLGTVNKKWDDGIIPYEIDETTVSNYSQYEINLIKSAMSLITEKTSGCITFKPKSANDSNWIQIKSLEGCWSYVGKWRVPGPQEISLQKNWCTWKGTIVHELTHAIGFWHEQNRPDRDGYIKVNYENIRPDSITQFDKYTWEGLSTFNTPYDYKSIMQYDEYVFSRNGNKTLEPLDPTVDLVPNYNKTDEQIYSEFDIASIRLYYQCGTNGTFETIKPEPYTTTTIRPVTTTLETTTTMPTTLPTSTGMYWHYTFTLVNDMDNFIYLFRVIKFNNYEMFSGRVAPGQQTTVLFSFFGEDWIVKQKYVNTRRFRMGYGKFIRRVSTFLISELEVEMEE